MPKPINPDEVGALAFGLAEEIPPGIHGRWHQHARHQLLYAASGALHLETARGRWLLPPQRAAVIGTGVNHRVHSVGRVQLATVYLRPRLLRDVQQDVTVFAVVPLAREMILGAQAWDATWGGRDKVGVAFFTALAGLTRQWMSQALPWHLPALQQAGLQRALDHILAHLDAPPTLAAVSRVAGMGQRTFARALEREAQVGFRALVHQARMLKAMEVLAQPNHGVTDAAYAVGFASLGAFTRAFTAFTGELPKDFRRHASATTATRAR